MIQWLGTSVALSEDLGLSLIAHIVVHNGLIPVLRDPTPSPGPMGTAHTQYAGSMPVPIKFKKILLCLNT